MELDADICKLCLSTDILSEYTIKRQHNFPSQWHFNVERLAFLIMPKIKHKMAYQIPT